jgi:hypothetical protein
MFSLTIPLLFLTFSYFSYFSYFLGKVQALRAELLIKVVGETNSQRFDKELLAAHDFLMPWFVCLDGRFFYLQKKKNWKELRVGFVGNSIRFQYVMDTLTSDLENWKKAAFEAKSFLFYTFEVQFNLICSK